MKYLEEQKDLVHVVGKRSLVASCSVLYYAQSMHEHCASSAAALPVSEIESDRTHGQQDPCNHRKPSVQVHERALQSDAHSTYPLDSLREELEFGLDEQVGAFQIPCTSNTLSAYYMLDPSTVQLP